jgi:ubiquinone/menaquinone biosynthesis C-methylase UbiE
MVYSEDLARRYAANREQYDETGREVIDAFAATGIQDTDILDFGCGDGKYDVTLKELGARTVTGIDRNPTMISLAKAREAQQGVEFYVADGGNLPFKSSKFDKVFSNFVIHYFEDETEAFSEISRVLKLQGVFVSTFNVCEVAPGAEKLFNTYMPIRLGQDGIVVQNLIKSSDAIMRALENSGFIIKEYRELHHPNAVIDDTYEHIDKVKKRVILCIAQKIRAPKEQTV